MTVSVLAALWPRIHLFTNISGAVNIGGIVTDWTIRVLVGHIK